jgi:hypothetical protein
MFPLIRGTQECNSLLFTAGHTCATFRGALIAGKTNKGAKQMLKILGILVLLGGVLFFLIGAGGAVMNFVFPPNELVCQYAADDLRKADDAAKRYEKAKGTSDEVLAKAEAERLIKAAQASGDSCGQAKDSHRFYGFIFVGVAVVGGFGFLLGAVITFFGFRRKRSA